VTCATQTSDLNSVVLPNTNLVGARTAVGQCIDSHPLGDVRPWGKHAGSLPLSTKGTTLYLKQRKVAA